MDVPSGKGTVAVSTLVRTSRIMAAHVAIKVLLAQKALGAARLGTGEGWLGRRFRGSPRRGTETVEAIHGDGMDFRFREL